MERIAFGTVAAQQVSLSARATTPLTAAVDLGGVPTTEVVPGCDDGTMECVPEFASNGVRLVSDTGPLTVLLLGAQSQPWSYNGTFGVCDVVPSPDVLLTLNGPLSLPIPASVRPFTFYAQALYVASYWWGGTAIGATSAFRVSAW